MIRPRPQASRRSPRRVVESALVQATSLFGGTAPAVSDWLISATGDTLMPAYYMMGACAIGMLALHYVPETAGASLRGRQIPGVA